MVLKQSYKKINFRYYILTFENPKKVINVEKRNNFISRMGFKYSLNDYFVTD